MITKELVTQWCDEWYVEGHRTSTMPEYIAQRAAAYGAEQREAELMAVAAREQYHNAYVEGVLESYTDFSKRITQLEADVLHKDAVIEQNSRSAQQRISQLEAALLRANSNHEEFERKWYLETDKTEKLEAALRVAREAILAFKLLADSIIGAQGGNLLLRVPIDTIQKQAAAIASIDSVGVTK